MFNLTLDSGHTPFFLTFRRGVQVPVDIMYGSSVPEEKINQYIGRVHEELQSSYSAGCQEDYYERKSCMTKKCTERNTGKTVWCGFIQQ